MNEESVDAVGTAGAVSTSGTAGSAGAVSVAGAGAGLGPAARVDPAAQAGPPDLAGPPDQAGSAAQADQAAHAGPPAQPGPPAHPTQPTQPGPAAQTIPLAEPNGTAQATPPTQPTLASQATSPAQPALASQATPPAQPDPAAQTTPPVQPTYRIEDLAHHSGATVRTIRAYQDRGLLPRPERRGRANVYADAHLARLRQIADLLDRGYTLASIKELLEAWDAGRGLGGVLGLVAEVDGPWTDEEPVRISRADLDERFGGSPDAAALADAIALGVLEPVPGDEELFLVPSPQELDVAVELYAAGVPLPAISSHLRELRGQVEHIASRFLEFTTEHVFARYLGGHAPSDAEAAEAASLVRRLRPLAQQTVDAELARAMRLFANRYLRQQLGADKVPQPMDEAHFVAIPATTTDAIARLVGAGQVDAFIAAAAEREVQARTLDQLTANHNKKNIVG